MYLKHTWGGEPLDVPIALDVPVVGVAGVDQRRQQPHRLVEAVPLLHWDLFRAGQQIQDEEPNSSAASRAGSTMPAA